MYRCIFQRMSESLERILCENTGTLEAKSEGMKKIVRGRFKMSFPRFPSVIHQSRSTSRNLIHKIPKS